MLRFALIFWRVLSSRAVRVLLYVWVLLWGVDRAIFWATEAAWFGSVGQGGWFETRFLTEFALFWGSFLAALASAAWAMRVARRPFPETLAAGEAPALPRALERLEPVRQGATRLAWVVLVLGAWLVARQIAAGWPLWLAARAGVAPVVWQWPLAQLASAALGEWLLLLLGATAFAGLLRALPFLARREPFAPLRLWRALGALGALALLVRGASYGIESASALSSDGVTGSELWVRLPLHVVGALLCLGAAFWCLKRPGFKRLIAAIALALLVPRVAGALLSPLGTLVPVPKNIEARALAATRAGWNLDEAPVLAGNAPPLAAHWPIWNQEALLSAARGEYNRYKGQVVDWRAAFVEGTRGTVVGVPASLENWGSRHEAEPESALQWLTFDASQSAEGAPPEIADAPQPLRSFYGIGGRPLAGNAPLDAGVPIDNWAWKVAWIWRLRDPLLLLDGARASRLLVFRGARESAQRLAPFLVWDEARLRVMPDGARWEIVGYEATAYFRGARALDEGAFAGSNAVAPTVRATVDPRNGRVEWSALSSAGWGQVLGAGRAGAPLMMPLWDEAQAQMARQLGARDVLTEPVWTWSAGRGQFVWRASNWPGSSAQVEARLATLDGAAARDWKSIEGETLQKGDALLWPDARAPGGFWVGRPFYGVTRVGGGVARAARLWRVSLTGIAAAAPVVSGDDARAALLEFDLGRGASSGTPDGSAPAASAQELALEALRAHDAAQKAAKNSNWGEWARQSARERQLIEDLTATPRL